MSGATSADRRVCSNVRFAPKSRHMRCSNIRSLDNLVSAGKHPTQCLAGKTKSRDRPAERLAASEALLDFESTCSNPSINLKYSGPSLSISASACLVSVSTAQTELVKGVFATAVAALAYISPIILA